MASGGPPPRFFEAQKTRGGVYFTWSGEIFLRNFLPYPPQNIPGLKGGCYYGYYMVIIWLLYGYYMVIIWLMMVNNNNLYIIWLVVQCAHG